jgi:hypothetical protein
LFFSYVEAGHLQFMQFCDNADDKQAKGFISGPSARTTKDLLELNRDQLRWVVGLFTVHCHLKGHLFKLGLTVIQLVKGAYKKTNQPHISYVIVRP